MSKDTVYSNNITPLRLAAAWVVLLNHSFALYDNSKDLFVYYLGFWGMGSIAMSIFFIISGYLLTASWKKQYGLKRFLANRALRIFPALIIITLFCVFVLGPAMTTLPLKQYFTMHETWMYLSNMFGFWIEYNLPGLFQDNPYPVVVNGSLWTLPVELAMYLLLEILGL